MQPSEEKPERVEVRVQGVYMHQEEGQTPQHFVVLNDGQKRRVPIWMGQYEAWAISYALEGGFPERPMTHDLTLTLLQAAGASVVEATVTDLRDETFYATMTLQVGEETNVVDARPSDAVALALRAHAPIFVAEEVMAAVGRTD